MWSPADQMASRCSWTILHRQAAIWPQTTTAAHSALMALRSRMSTRMDCRTSSLPRAPPARKPRLDCASRHRPVFSTRPGQTRVTFSRCRTCCERVRSKFLYPKERWETRYKWETPHLQFDDALRMTSARIHVDAGGSQD